MSSDKVIGVAIVGVGLVALNTHIPNLQLCSHMFKVRALVDVSPGALSHASDKFAIPKDRTYNSVDDMLANASDIDLVMIMSADEYHVEQTVKSLRAGKDVFVEKPMALSLEGAEEIERVQKETGKIVFVGFMRRYAEAFLRVKDVVQKTPKGEINYVRVRDIIGDNAFFVAESGAFPRSFNDAPAAAVEDRKKRADQMLQQALGERASNKADEETYRLLASLSSHDLSAMRELIGMPQSVIGAQRSPDGQWIWVMFQYDGFVAYYEVGIDNTPIFDAHIGVYTKKERAKVTYDTPFVKGLPITATIQTRRENGDFVEETVRPTYEDAFMLEYRQLYAAVVDGKPVKTTATDAKEDLVLFRMVMDALKI